MYALHPRERTFAEYVGWHLAYGFVLSRPDVFVMGRPIVRREGESGVKWMANRDGDVAGRCDTWFVHAASGNIQRAWELIPWNLPWIAWERTLDRTRELRFYDAGRVRRLLMRPTLPILSI